MNRTFIYDLWDTIAGRRKARSGEGEPVTSRTDMALLAGDLLSGRGEASGVRLARDLLAAYDRADKAGRLDFLQALTHGFGPDAARLEVAIERYLAHRSLETAAELSAASEPGRQEVLRRLNHAPGGTAALVRMREDVLAGLPDNPDLGILDSDFAHLFSSWFNRGFLVLRRIDWTTPANILAKIIRYEAVHTIQSWDDLRNRLEPPDRRCFAFFHPQMADEPLVFVEVALTRESPGAIQPLLEIERSPLAAEQATTAVFYSISNCQAGLKGVSFGNFLIKQVVEELRRDLPALKTFATLSPAPGFMRWLAREVAAPQSMFIPPEDAVLLKDLPATGEAARKALTSAAAAYYLAARTSSKRPVDAVARFHLGNGARLERINRDGDLSANGMHQSGGVMVNYLYDPETIEANHEAFANQGSIIASPAVRQWLKLLPARTSAGHTGASPPS